MTDSDDSPVLDDPDVTIGTTVYTEDGTEIGTVRGILDDGIVVTTREGITALSIEHERAGHEFGEAELMWRCTSCGEMGDLEDGVPDECPNCGSPREDIYYWIED